MDANCYPCHFEIVAEWLLPPEKSVTEIKEKSRNDNVYYIIPLEMSEHPAIKHFPRG